MRKPLLLLALLALVAELPAADEKTEKTEPVSFYKQIRPIFQANCQELPISRPRLARRIRHDQLRTHPSSRAAIPGDAAIVKGKAAASHLVAMIEPKDAHRQDAGGRSRLDRQPAIDLIRRWTGSIGGQRRYAGQRGRRTVRCGASAGLHAGLHRAVARLFAGRQDAGGGRLPRWCCCSMRRLTRSRAGSSASQADRMRSLSSPDGRSLADLRRPAGRMGEIQVWDVAKKSCGSRCRSPIRSTGSGWSSDGTHLAFGCTVLGAGCRCGEGRAGDVPGEAMPTGCWLRSSRPTTRTSFRRGGQGVGG